MRNLFSAPPDPNAPAGPVVPAAGGGWTNLSSPAKIAIFSGVVAVGAAAMLWPGFSATPSAPPPATEQAHPPATLSDFQAPPLPPTLDDVVKKLHDDPPPDTRTPPPAMHYRPVPTEMALYRLPSNGGTATTAAAATPAAAPGAGSAAPDTGLPPTHKAMIIKHPDFVIRAGDVIPCLPVGHQNSEKQGFETCNVPIWFRSTNQRRGLLPPHTRLFGRMQSGMLAGEQRIGIIYSLIETPWFSMPVDSPAGDALGATGLDKVDVQTFFWERLRGVALYAMLDTLVNAGQTIASEAASRAFSSNSNNGNSYGPSFNFGGGSRSQMQSLAGKEFDATINRPPIGTRAPALPVTVIAGQDLDFYDACLQALRVDPMACPLQ